MATKADITTQIAGRADGGANPISTERALWETFRDTGYGNVITEGRSGAGDTSGVVTESLDIQHYYSLSFARNNRILIIKGQVTNKTGSTQSNGEYFDFIGEYTNYSGASLPIFATDGNGNVVRCQATAAGRFRVVDPIANNQTIYVDGTVILNA